MTALAVAVTGASGQVGTALLRSRPANVAVTALSRRAPVGAATERVQINVRRVTLPWISLFLSTRTWT